MQMLKTFQELLGHADVSTTMIYTHVLNTPGVAVRSPVDSLSLMADVVGLRFYTQADHPSYLAEPGRVWFLAVGLCGFASLRETRTDYEHEHRSFHSLSTTMNRYADQFK